jgi:hypothetical protein
MSNQQDARGGCPLNEEQHRQPLQPDRLNREEVDREQAASMDPNESIGPPLRH